MTDIDSEAATRPGVPVERSSVLRRFFRNPLAVTALVIVTLVVLVGVFAPVLAPFAPNQSRLMLVNAPPGTAPYLLGGDGAGRDVLSRLMYASRLTLLGSFITVTVAALLGVTAGLVAGYWGGWLDKVGGWLANFLIVLPGTIVLVCMFTLIGPNIMLTMVILGVLIAPNFFRLVRNLVIGVRGELYVDAARVSGLSDIRIVGRHILSVVRAPIIIMCAQVWGIAIVVQAGLEFLGLGDPTTPTWGSMLLDAYNNFYIGRHLLLPPGLSIGVTVASFILIGNGLRDALNTSESSLAGKTRPAKTANAAAENRPVPRIQDRSRAGLLEIHDLSIGYAARGGLKTVVQSAGFEVGVGEIVGLVGESGSGKTQTALAAMHLLPNGGMITGGTIRLEGEDLAHLPPARMRAIRGRRIGYIPQEPMSNLDPLYRIGYQLCEPMQAVLGIARREARERSMELLERVGIADPARVFDCYPHQISGGMAQRVLIAGALSCSPRLLIADEPTTALDVTVQADILDLIRDLQRELKLGVLMITHNFGVVADICERVVVMRDGLVVEQGSVRETFANPRHPYTRSLLASTLEGAPLRKPLGHNERREPLAREAMG